MFKIRSDMNPAIIGLAWLVGQWTGTGYRQWPGAEKISYGIQVDFAENGGDYLHYLSQSFEVDDEGRPVKALAMETGFWRPRADASLDITMCSPEGYAEIWYGKLQPGRVDLLTDAVVRAADATSSYSAGRRLYGLVDGKLMFSFDRATAEHELQPYIWATLERRHA